MQKKKVLAPTRPWCVFVDDDGITHQIWAQTEHSFIKTAQCAIESLHHPKRRGKVVLARDTLELGDCVENGIDFGWNGCWSNEKGIHTLQMTQRYIHCK